MEEPLEKIEKELKLTFTENDIRCEIGIAGTIFYICLYVKVDGITSSVLPAEFTEEINIKYLISKSIADIIEVKNKYVI